MSWVIYANSNVDASLAQETQFDTYVIDGEFPDIIVLS